MSTDLDTTKNQGKWPYSDLEIRNLETKERYRQTYLPERIKLFQKAIVTHDPRAVIFYSSGSEYREAWSNVCGGKFEEFPINNGPKIRHHYGKRTHFFVIPHPTARLKGLTSAYWGEVGILVKKLTKTEVVRQTKIEQP